MQNNGRTTPGELTRHRGSKGCFGISIAIVIASALVYQVATAGRVDRLYTSRYALKSGGVSLSEVVQLRPARARLSHQIESTSKQLPDLGPLILKLEFSEGLRRTFDLSKCLHKPVVRSLAAALSELAAGDGTIRTVSTASRYVRSIRLFDDYLTAQGDVPNDCLLAGLSGQQLDGFEIAQRERWPQHGATAYAFVACL